ncbi:secreted RxLR effector protein 161-like [Lactuca sativa]|uniref:secreted RxLR effector protein 161-like n=1 Tax=Lactuca sativa TaxID=4236 RepID=UPI0022AFA783|nr:secreted RxLR effector protein 161-like [Lactuca sativa]
MDTCASAKVPMGFGHKIFANPSGGALDEKKYNGMIGSLLYITASRPDIMFSTCFCARFQVNPKMSHLLAAKQIFRYLKGTKNFEIRYPANEIFLLKAYSDSNYGGLQLDRKSKSGRCQLLGGRLVSWSSKKQNCIALSTDKAKYIAASSCTSQVLWMKSQLLDYGYRFQRIPIYFDSQSAIAISHNPIQYSMTKHIDIWYHFIKDHVLNGNIELIFVPSNDEIANVFTKTLDETKFNGFLNKMELHVGI